MALAFVFGLMLYHAVLRSGLLTGCRKQLMPGGPGGCQLQLNSMIANDPATASDATEAPNVITDGAGHPQRVTNLNRWVVPLIVADATAAAITAFTLLALRFGVQLAPSNRRYYVILELVLVPAWVLTMTLAGTYEARFIAAGTEQYRRIVNGAAWLLAILAFTAFALHYDVSRILVLGSVPVVAFLTTAERYAIRKFLQRKFREKWVAHRVIAIGSADEVADLVNHMSRVLFSGFRVVAAVTPEGTTRPSLPGDVSWVKGGLDDVVATAVGLGADTLALAGAHVLPRGGLRRLSWQLEGTKIDLVVVPALTDIAGPRIRIRPVEGLPLLHIDRPQFTGVRRLVKTSIDRVTAAWLLTILSPLLVLVAVIVKVSSKGPILFRQTRVGLNGEQFQLLKIRTMVPTARPPGNWRARPSATSRSVIRRATPTSATVSSVHSTPSTPSRRRLLTCAERSRCSARWRNEASAVARSQIF